MKDFLCFLGAIHLAAYAIAGLAFAAMLFAEWLIARLGLTRDFILAAQRMFQDRRAAKRGPPA